MAALACPAVHMLGCAPNFPPCRALAYGCPARRLLPMAVLPSPDCTVENFAWRENSGKGHRLLPLARLLQSCVREVEIRRIFGVSAPPFQTLSTPLFQPLLPPPFQTPVPTHLPTLIQTHLHTLLGTLFRTPLGTLLGTLLGTPVQTLFPPPFLQVCATFFATSPDTSAKLRNRHDLYCRQVVNCGVLPCVTKIEVSHSIC